MMMMMMTMMMMMIIANDMAPNLFIFAVLHQSTKHTSF